ncbi:diacylglycerol kinase family protein [Candidatus Daviesbacteria bacterium]|nr:diacylglycerol kinase family protein [Candidatus Daviesbacteria bacterium]
MNPKRFHILSFKYAFEGLVAALKEEPNLKFHLLTGLVAILISIYLKLSTIDWIIIILVIGFVITVELTNTAIEKVVNEFTDQIHPGAKLAKDISAAAALVASVTAAVVGLIIFIPYFTI